MQRRRKTANMAFVVTSIVSRLSSCATRLYNVGVVSHVNYWVFGFAIATDPITTGIMKLCLYLVARMLQAC